MHCVSQGKIILPKLLPEHIILRGYVYFHKDSKGKQEKN